MNYLKQLSRYFKPITKPDGIYQVSKIVVCESVHTQLVGEIYVRNGRIGAVRSIEGVPVLIDNNLKVPYEVYYSKVDNGDVASLLSIKDQSLGDRIKHAIDNPPTSYRGIYTAEKIIVSGPVFLELVRDERFVSGSRTYNIDYIFGLPVVIEDIEIPFSIVWHLDERSAQEMAHWVYQQDESFFGINIHYPKSQ